MNPDSIALLDQPPSFAPMARGRRLAYGEYGDPAGIPLVYCHGFPSSRREALLLHPAACAVGVRLIAADRPGYGASEFDPDRRIPDWADDCARLLDHLGLERATLAGISGGGPYALACAAAMPERLDGCLLVCPLGPVYRPEVLAEMRAPSRNALWLASRLPVMTRLVYGEPASHLFARWPQTVEWVRDAAAPPVDRDQLADPRVRAIMNRTIQDALDHGARGARQDIQLYTRPWGLRYAEIGFPIDLWHGEDDGTVPVAHAHWYARHLPRCTTHILPAEGHFSLPLCHAETILRDLRHPIQGCAEPAAAPANRRASIDAPHRDA
ncbi:alpha/beta hydrolase [Thioalkalicoccus limnaeus]|uniref:Alpha/beta hydrolase n=1 Tax=Thioalkalicoccus limnaeus TaxID=120681 RepID=A0ABV4BDE4_9GAMM